jgi:hypothetical protein
MKCLGGRSSFSISWQSSALKTAAEALKVGGVGDQDGSSLRGRMRAAPSVAAVKEIESALRAKLPAFKPWTRPG